MFHIGQDSRLYNQFTKVQDTFSDDIEKIEKVVNSYDIVVLYGETETMGTPGDGYILKKKGSTSNDLVIPKDIFLTYVRIKSKNSFTSADNFKLYLKSSSDSNLDDVELTDAIAKATANAGKYHSYYVFSSL